MRQFNFPKAREAKKYIGQYYQSLLPYYEYYKPPLVSLFGENIPKHVCYLCPLCLENLFIISDDGGIFATGAFNLDHYPPKCIGGKKEMLVCERCNNLSGRQYESTLTDFLNLLCYNKKINKASIDVSAALKGVGGKPFAGSYKIKLKRDTEGNRVLDFGAKKYQFVEEWIESTINNKDWQITLSGELPSEKKIAQSVVKAAYLYCFSLWGYEFAFSSGAAKLRDFLKGEVAYPFKKGYAYLLYENLLQIPQGVCFIEKPVEIRNFVVHVPMILPDCQFKCIAGVVIPNPTNLGWDVLFNFPKESENVIVRAIYPFDINQRINGYSDTWNKILSTTFTL